MNENVRSQPRIRRRDFLAGAGAMALALSMPPKAAVARSGGGEPAPAGAAIVRLGIYPALGISRVGGSDDWFHAPEVPGLPPRPKDGSFKDGTQRIKKQVQRFRVYSFDDKGRVIREVTAAEATIEWRVHVANTKAAWYGFNNPLDNGDLAPGLPGQKRNQYFVTDRQREKMLVIDGGETKITGVDTNNKGGDPDYAMGGKFYDREPVGLGELRTDAAGRLLVFPPDGVSNSPVNSPITNFADNDGWHDDWCDGPVTATVTFDDGSQLEADHAWVASVGPNFAPEIPPVSNLYDVINDVNVSQEWTKGPAVPLSFVRYIYPTFRRLALMEWVSSAANLRQGWMNIGDFSDPAYVRRLADPSFSNLPFRTSIFNKFRDPYNNSANAYKDERLKLPYMLGDGINYDGSPLQWFRFPLLQYSYLQSWVAGDFIDDLDDFQIAIERLEDVPIEAQPHALTEAALEPCSGGAFHPGVELTYYLRNATLFARYYDNTAEPFRIARGDRPSLIQNIGRLLTAETARQGGNGAPPPLGKQMRGDLTRWLGLPWQCDAFSCQQVLMQEQFPTAVWWPALLPIDVLPERYYHELMRTDLQPAQRVKFFESRVAWSRGVAGIGYHANASYFNGITNMISLWERMGFVVSRPGPADPDRPAAIPDQLFVEVGRGNMELGFDWKPGDGQLPN